MSVIAAMTCSATGATWIGSDTLMCSATLRQIVGPKWIRHSPWALGVAGHLRALNLFQHNAAELLGNLDGPFEFAGRARELLKADGFTTETNGNGGPIVYGQMLILARPGAVWAIAADFSVMSLAPDRLWAEGSGRELAVGAGHALVNSGFHLAADDVVRRAVETAIAYETSCGGEAWVDRLTA
ncbi:hypothetical protein GCM10017083_28050 [Thalassobaculum fulvum]|uniref:Uncharacterized protein n=1 Tax=Thalassobaculum fulvum TaxID=1633335 RepID=A0A918XU29_9PROT|nr:hypothetical protein [Thalassobaculum fulvum]GHD52559.1 hypothetical protein GCM10017083_28050 [Thalassobaculum fulvum]